MDWASSIAQRSGAGEAAGSLGRSRTVGSFIHAFSPAPRWDQIATWPPDVFAVSNLIIDHTQAYRFVVAPPRGGRWPPSLDWNQRVASAARAWRAAASDPRAALPTLVSQCWKILSEARSLPLGKIESGEAWDVCVALLTLHAVADEACAWLSAPAGPVPCPACEQRAWEYLAQTGSLSRLSPSRIRVVPKGRFTTRGITVRSLSRYLALCYESVDLHWTRVGPDAGVAAALAGRQDYNLVLIPWPLTIKATDFHPAATPLGNMDEDVFGFFEFEPSGTFDVDYVRSLLQAARAQVERIDAVVLPESALEPDHVAVFEDALLEFGATFLIAGVRTRGAEGVFGRNYLHLGIHTAAGWQHFDQDKHHRWSLDGRQIRQYHLARALDPRKLWWEAVNIGPRAINLIDFGGGATTAPLVCEDLARMDEVSDLLRRIGPSVVIAVLLDGPQLVSRWPSRYASILSDEPGSAVLTLTSYGMAARSRPDGLAPSRAVALWTSSAGTAREIELRRRSDAVAITLSVSNRSVWTADGRCHADVPFVTLSRERQVSVPSSTRAHERPPRKVRPARSPRPRFRQGRRHRT